MKQNAHMFSFLKLKHRKPMRMKKRVFLYLPLFYVTQTTFRFKATEHKTEGTINSIR